MTKLTKRERRRPIVVALRNRLSEMSPEDQEDFAELCGTSYKNLLQITYGWSGCSITKAKLIVAACDGDVDLSDLIPELRELIA